MDRQYNAPTTIQIYLGTGKPGSTLRENIDKKRGKRQSLSEYVVDLMRKADPSLFKGVDDGK